MRTVKFILTIEADEDAVRPFDGGDSIEAFLRRTARRFKGRLTKSIWDDEGLPGERLREVHRATLEGKTRRGRQARYGVGTTRRGDSSFNYWTIDRPAGNRAVAGPYTDRAKAEAKAEALNKLDRRPA
jgi:hypothetical protein